MSLSVSCFIDQLWLYPERTFSRLTRYQGRPKSLLDFCLRHRWSFWGWPHTPGSILKAPLVTAQSRHFRCPAQPHPLTHLQFQHGHDGQFLSLLGSSSSSFPPPYQAVASLCFSAWEQKKPTQQANTRIHGAESSRASWTIQQGSGYMSQAPFLGGQFWGSFYTVPRRSLVDWGLLVQRELTL